jgi:hypothetical protein
VFGLLQQPEYVHVLISHLPLTGLFAARLCVIVALKTRNRAAMIPAAGPGRDPPGL